MTSCTLLSRRQILSGAIAGSSLVAAPQIVSSLALASSAALSIIGWPDYVPPSILEEFGKTTGIKVTLTAIQPGDEALAKIMSAPGSYDVFYPYVSGVSDRETARVS
jgi:spermidine/putrescine-binding protein